MKDRGYTDSRSCNNPQKHMSGPKMRDGGMPGSGMDLSRDATNVIRKLGLNPEPAGPVAKPQNK